MAESTNAANTARYGGGRLHPPPPPAPPASPGESRTPGEPPLFHFEGKKTLLFTKQSPAIRRRAGLPLRRLPPPLRAAPVESWTVTPPTPLPPAPKGQLSNGTETHTPPPRAGPVAGGAALTSRSRRGSAGAAAPRPRILRAQPRPLAPPSPRSRGPPASRRCLPRPGACCAGLAGSEEDTKLGGGGSRSPFSAKHNSLRIKRRVLMA